ncbi:MAG: nitroreductase family protein [Promethearchaeota archaeon]
MVETKEKVKKIGNSKINVDLSICTKCEACVRECPARLYYIREKQLFIRRSADIMCIECGHCVAICPVKAIKLNNFSIENVIDISKDFKIPSYNHLLNLIKSRRSIRQFNKDPIPKDLWEKLIEAGRYSPTGHNSQNVHFTIVRNPELLKKFSDEITKGFMNLSVIFEDPKKRSQLKSLVPKEYLQLTKMILLGFKEMLKGMERGEEFWRWKGKLLVIHGPKNTTGLIYDCAVAASSIMLAAESLGLGTCSLGMATIAVNQFEAVAQVIELPKNHIAGYILAVGFPKVKYYRIPPRQPGKVKWL